MKRLQRMWKRFFRVHEYSPDVTIEGEWGACTASSFPLEVAPFGPRLQLRISTPWDPAGNRTETQTLTLALDPAEAAELEALIGGFAAAHKRTHAEHNALWSRYNLEQRQQKETEPQQ